MKMKTIYILTICLIGMLLFSGCVESTGSASNKTIQVGNSSDLDSVPETINVTKGSEFTISLEANMTTGYSWQAYIDDESIAALKSNEYEPEDTDRAGSAGVAILTFTALEKGETALKLEYAQDWEGGEVGQSKEVTIIVE